MHPLFSDARHLIWYLAACMLVGNIAAYIMNVNGLPHVNAVFFCLPVCLMFGFVVTSAYYVCRSMPLSKRRLARLLAAYGWTSLLSGLILLLICAAWGAVGDMIGATWSTLPAARNSPMTVFCLGAGAYLFSILTHDVFLAVDNLRLAELRERESRTLAREAELQLLRMQINPHFLFNSLNSISALTSIDAAGARSMTIALAQFFRQTLALAKRDTIPLQTELALCRSFLEVEKIRFGSKLDTELVADEAARAALIPPLILQPLLENAIKHGIRTLAEGGRIDARAEQRDGWLHLTVTNPMDPNAAASQGTGTGLENIKRRCATLYDGRARVEWGSQEPGRFTVHLTLPYETA